MEVKIQTGDLGVFNGGGHELMSLDSLNSIAVDELTLGAALPVGLEDIDILDVILGSKYRLGFNSLDRADDQVREEGRIRVDKLARHGGPSAVVQSFISEALDSDCELIFDVSACLLGSHFVPHYDASGVHFHFDEFVGSLQQLGGQNND